MLKCATWTTTLAGHDRPARLGALLAVYHNNIKPLSVQPGRAEQRGLPEFLKNLDTSTSQSGIRKSFAVLTSCTLNQRAGARSIFVLAGE